MVASKSHVCCPILTAFLVIEIGSGKLRRICTSMMNDEPWIVDILVQLPDRG